MEPLIFKACPHYGRTSSYVLFALETNKSQFPMILLPFPGDSFNEIMQNIERYQGIK